MRTILFTAQLAGLVCVTMSAPAEARATTAGAGEERLALETVATGLDSPVWAGSPPGDSRVFVVELSSARILIVEAGVTLATPFLDLSAQTLAVGQSGLLSIAFHPQFATNGEFFVYYTIPDDTGMFPTTNPCIVRLERFTVSADPNVADATSGEVILDLPNANLIHKGAGPLFGPDGLLYIVFGEGGIGGVNPIDACAVGRLDNWYGKILRIDVDNGSPYAIPADNPFLQTPGALPEIYHLGLRSPWRASFDFQTGDLYLADVGVFSYEEIHVALAGQAGLNFGHPVVEGNDCNLTCAGVLLPCGNSEYQVPIHQYPNTASSAIGGYVYRGVDIPTLAGTYFFADFTADELWSLRYDSASGVTQLQERSAEIDPTGALRLIDSFGEDGNGEPLIVSWGGFPGTGVVYRIVAFENTTYCVAKPAVLADVTCSPRILPTVGLPSLQLPTPLDIPADQVPNGKNGLFFYGTNGPNNVPFLGGTLCVGLPLRRTDVINSGGSAPGTEDCSGSFHFDFNAWLQAGNDPAVAPGTQVNGQYWFRLPSDPFGSGLTNAVSLIVGP